MKDLWTINVALAMFNIYCASITIGRSVFWLNAAFAMLNVAAVVLHFAV